MPTPPSVQKSDKDGRFEAVVINRVCYMAKACQNYRVMLLRYSETAQIFISDLLNRSFTPSFQTNIIEFQITLETVGNRAKDKMLAGHIGTRLAIFVLFQLYLEMS